jgi:hypothetical protein
MCPPAAVLHAAGARTRGVGKQAGGGVGQPLRLHRQRMLAHKVELGGLVCLGGALQRLR